VVKTPVRGPQADREIAAHAAGRFRPALINASAIATVASKGQAAGVSGRRRRGGQSLSIEHRREPHRRAPPLSVARHRRSIRA